MASGQLSILLASIKWSASILISSRVDTVLMAEMKGIYYESELF